MIVISVWYLPILVSFHKPFIVFSLPCPAKDVSDRAALVDSQGQPTTVLLVVHEEFETSIVIGRGSG